MIYRKNTGKEEIKKLVKAGELTLAGCNAKKQDDKTYGQIGIYNPETDTYWVKCSGGRTLLKYAKKDESTSNQVFFKDEKEALNNGYRPCFFCFPTLHAEWKASTEKEAWRKKRLADLDNTQ